MSDSSHLEYKPHLDGLRAVAVLLVFFFHALPGVLPGGFIGVDVFFVLSGYLITRILARRHAQTGKWDLAGFYVRRLRRLLPAVVCLVVVVAIQQTFSGPLQFNSLRLEEIWATLFYATNWLLVSRVDDYFAQTAAVSPLRHAWSLSVEEQYYLLWPVLLLTSLSWGRGAGYRRAVVGALGLAVLSAALMAANFDPAYVSRAYYGSDCRIHQMLVGGALGLMFETRSAAALAQSHSPRLAGAIASATFLILLAASHALRGDAATYFYGGAVGIALVVVVSIATLELEPTCALARLLAARPLNYLGRISYGFYLWHWPAIAWTRDLLGLDGDSASPGAAVAIALAATIGLAALSFHFVELPIRRGDFGIERLGSRMGIAAFLAASIITGAAVTPLFRSSSNEIVARALADPSAENCPGKWSACVKHDAGHERPVIALIGDSTAQAYDPALKLLAAKHDFTYVQAAVGGCPLGHRLLARGKDGALHSEVDHLCYERMPKILESVISKWHPVLFIGTSRSELNPHVEDGIKVVSGSPAHLARFSRELEKSLSSLAAGATVVMLELVPDGPLLDCLRGDQSDCTTYVRQDDVVSALNAATRESAERVSRVAVVSMTDYFCPEAHCPLQIDGDVVRYDGVHLTATMSRRIAPVLEAELREVGIDLSKLADEPRRAER